MLDLRWILLLNTLVTTMAASAFFYGQAQSSIIQEILVIVFLSIFNGVQRKMVMHLLENSAPDEWNENQEINHIERNVWARNIFSCGIYKGDKVLSNFKKNLEILNEQKLEASKLDEVKEVLMDASELFFAMSEVFFKNYGTTSLFFHVLVSILRMIFF